MLTIRTHKTPPKVNLFFSVSTLGGAYQAVRSLTYTVYITFHILANFPYQMSIQNMVCQKSV